MDTSQHLERLGSLAAGLCQDAGVGLEVTPAAQWAWDPVRRVMVVAGPDLEQHGPEFCAGVLAHEVGHFYLSRHAWLSVQFPLEPAVRYVLNALEDSRVNTWMRRRYPGCDSWLERVADLEWAHSDGKPVPKVIEFAREAAREAWLNWAVAPRGSVSPEVASALARTRVARQRYADILPPADLDPSAFGPGLARRYRDEIWPRLGQRARKVLPSPREQGVRLSALRAVELAEAEILPTVWELLSGDVKQLAEYLRDNPEEQVEADSALYQNDQAGLERLAGQASRHQSSGAGSPRPDLNLMALGVQEKLLAHLNRAGRHAPLTEADESQGQQGTGQEEGEGEEQRQARERRRSLRRSRRRGRSQSREIGGAAESRGAGGGAEAIGQVSTPTGYEAFLRRVGMQVQQLSQMIEDELRPVKRMADRRGYPSGYKLDLRRLMRYEADARDYDKLWLRKTVPDRWSIAFSLLIDLSGSMQGEKVEAAASGAVLLAETLHRLNVPFLINGFHDTLIPFCSLGEGLLPHVRQAVGEMPQRVTGGTELAPCLQQASEELLNLKGYDERFMVVITDGEPNNGEHLQQVVADLLPLAPELDLVAFGLGPGTDSVRTYFPACKVNVPVEQIGAEIGGLLRQKLRASRRGGRPEE